MRLCNMASVPEGVRYFVSIRSLYQDQFVLYKMTVVDLVSEIKYETKFRFSQIKDLHQKIVDNYNQFEDQIPELPRTNSFFLWNRTNKNQRRIHQRKMDLQIYFEKLLNNPMMRGINIIREFVFHNEQKLKRVDQNRDFQNVEMRKYTVKQF